MKRYVIGIDQGTSGTFVGLMNDEGVLVADAYQAHQQIYPHPGWVEQDPLELWIVACALVNHVIAQAEIHTSEIAGIGLANQGESVMLWDRATGRPLYNALIWQDTRTQSRIDQLAADPTVEQQVTERTGLKLDSYFSASKLSWLLDHAPDAAKLHQNGTLAAGTLDSWMIWKMTGGQNFVTDASTASRTLLFNIHTGQWDDWLLDLFHVPRDILAAVCHSTGHFGVVTAPEMSCPGVPIVTSLVDQPAAMIGQGCLSAGEIKATYGTGCFINLNTGPLPVTSQHGLLTMLAWQRDDHPTFGLDGGVFTAAASVNWLCERVGLLPNTRDIDAICAQAKDSNQVMWVPAQIGLGAPYWDRTMRGAWLGLDLSTEPAHLIRAVLEGIAARVAQIVDAMRDDTALMISHLRVDGGLTHSATLMQIQSDLLGTPVEVLQDPQATASGVCGLAARASGLWEADEPILHRVKIAHTYEPSLPEDQRMAFLERFDRAIQHLKAWHNHV